MTTSLTSFGSIFVPMSVAIDSSDLGIFSSFKDSPRGDFSRPSAKFLNLSTKGGRMPAKGLAPDSISSPTNPPSLNPFTSFFPFASVGSFLESYLKSSLDFSESDSCDLKIEGGFI